MASDLSPTQIDLAREPAFSLGGLDVRPASLEVVAGERREAVEPRIMQVLVALARRRGEVVSREDLILTCWSGRIVGDDSINRCILRLRKLAEGLGGFTIATVPRVGFRLTEVAVAADLSRRIPRRPVTIAIAAIALMLTLGAGVWLWRTAAAPRSENESRVAVQDFRILADDREAAAFGATLTDDIGGMLGEYGGGVALTGPGDSAATPDLVIRGTITRQSGQWRVRVYLEDARAKAVIWSDQFERTVAEGDQLRLQVAVAVTDMVVAAATPRLEEGLTLDPGALGLFLRGSQAMSSPALVRRGPEESIRAMEQVVARAPTFAAGHAYLAANLVSAASGLPAGERAAAQRRAREEADRAIRLNGKAAGASYDALFFLERQEAPGDLARAEDVLIRAEAAAGAFPFTAMRRCQFLLEVGRAGEALTHCDRAIALRPLAAPIRFRQARVLAALGRQDLADKAIAQSVLYRPEHFPTRLARFEMRAFTGSPDEALALLHDPSAPPFLLADQAAAFQVFLQARKTGASADIDRAIQRLRDLSERTGPRYLIMGAASLGRLDEAFAAADGLGPEQLLASAGSGILFEPATAPMRRDPRFWKVAAKTGLLRYWRVRGVWPDFCADNAVGVDCKVAAIRAG